MTENNNQASLKLSNQLSYALGEIGCGMLINIISLFFVAFYLAPAHLKLPTFVSQAPIFAIFSLFAIAILIGRFSDAITDPIIAHFSDQHKSKTGSRKKYLIVGLIPSLFFCVLLFAAPIHTPSLWNILWLITCQILFYSFFSIYRIPYLALMTDLAKTKEDKMNLATWLSVASAISIVIAAQCPLIWTLLQNNLHFTPLAARQLTIGLFAILAGVFMSLPVFLVKENKDQSSNIESKFRKSIKEMLKNPQYFTYSLFILLINVGYIILVTGLPFYITVLLKLPENAISWLLPLMVLVSLATYPIINKLGKKHSKKTLLLWSSLVYSLNFIIVIFLGHFSVSPHIQAIVAITFAAIPLAFIQVIPLAILTEISEAHAEATGQNKNGLFFAGREFFIKVGHGVGAAIFACALLLGNDVGNDFGIRASAILGIIFSVGALVVFMRFRESPKQA